MVAVALCTQLIQHLQGRGERLTPQRRLVIEALCTAGDHLTIQTIQQAVNAVSPTPLSEVTIYRILVWLKACNVVAATDMGSAGVVYALIRQPIHHHLICLACGQTMTISDAYVESLRRQLDQDLGFMARIDHMAIYGYCRQCVEET